MHRNPLVRLAVVLMAFAAAVLAGAAPASATTDRPTTAVDNIVLSSGGVNLDAYCRSLGAVYAVRYSASPSGWSCQYQEGLRQSLSIGQACQYQLAPLIAAGLRVGEDSGSDPTQRRCLVVGSAVQNLGGMDLAGYCKNLGHGYNGSTNVGGVDGWYCTPRTATSRIDLNAVCLWQYGSRTTLTPAAFFLSAADAYRISCYGYR